MDVIQPDLVLRPVERGGPVRAGQWSPGRGGEHQGVGSASHVALEVAFKQGVQEAGDGDGRIPASVLGVPTNHLPFTRLMVLRTVTAGRFGSSSWRSAWVRAVSSPNCRPPWAATRIITRYRSGTRSARACTWVRVGIGRSAVRGLAAPRIWQGLVGISPSGRSVADGAQQPVSLRLSGRPGGGRQPGVPLPHPSGGERLELQVAEGGQDVQGEQPLAKVGGARLESCALGQPRHLCRVGWRVCAVGVARGDASPCHRCCPPRPASRPPATSPWPRPCPVILAPSAAGQPDREDRSGRPTRPTEQVQRRRSGSAHRTPQTTQPGYGTVHLGDALLDRWCGDVAIPILPTSRAFPLPRPDQPINHSGGLRLRRIHGTRHRQSADGGIPGRDRGLDSHADRRESRRRLGPPCMSPDRRHWRQARSA